MVDGKMPLRHIPLECAGHVTGIVGCKSPRRVFVEPMDRRRRRAAVRSLPILIGRLNQAYEQKTIAD